MSISAPRKDPLRPTMSLPEGRSKVLLHSCCAPCSGEVMEAMLASGIQYDIFFYNPNIHPVKEYEIRKNENIRFAEKNGIRFIDADYDVDNWFNRIKGLENEPERGERCTQCFDMRFERTALYAHEHGYDTITSSLGISRWKDMNQINRSGEQAAARYDDLLYWTYNWRKHRWVTAHDRNQQAGTVLSAGVLRLCVFVCGTPIAIGAVKGASASRSA